MKETIMFSEDSTAQVEGQVTRQMVELQKSIEQLADTITGLLDRVSQITISLAEKPGAAERDVPSGLCPLASAIAERTSLIIAQTNRLRILHQSVQL